MKKAHITFQGGLGNQMFQYLFLHFIRKIGFDVFLDTSLYDITKMHSGFILDKVFEVDEVKSSKMKLLSNNKFVKKLFQLGLGSRKVVAEENFNINKLDKFSEIRFVGYWQSKQFVEEMYGEINSVFSFITNGFSKYTKSINTKIETTNSVSIHVRKGDYSDPKNKKIYGLCSVNYYKSAIEKLKKEIVEPLDIFVFSDDLSYAKELLNGIENCNFIEAGSEEEELYLMHKCKHNIIANSTFSWWGASLNSNKNKAVIYPNPWYDTQVGNGVFIPNSWTPVNKY